MSSSVSHRRPVDNLSEDVLAEIFSYIDGDELLDWQIVCRRWHRVINTLINWKIVLERKLRSSVTWRQVKKRLDHSARETHTDNKLLYRNIRRKIQELDHNWRSGKFSELDIDIDGETSNGADDDFLLNFKNEKVVLYDRQRLEIVHKVTGYYDSHFSRIHKGLLFLTKYGRGYKIVDAITGNEVIQLDDADYIHHVSICDWGLMAIVCNGRGVGNALLQMWKMTAATSEFIHETEYDRLRIRMELDNRIMAIFTVDADSRWADRKPVIILFIDHFSKSKRSLSVKSGGVGKEIAFHFDQGIFFLIHRDGRIRLMDVLNGQWLRTIHHKRWKYFVDGPISIHWTPMALNSKFMATLDKDDAPTGNSTIFIYDLEAATDPSADSGGLLLVTIHVPGFLFRDIQINETEVYGIGEIHRDDFIEFFKAFDFLGSGTGHEVICSVTKSGRAIRKPARYGQAKLRKRR